MKYKVRAGKVKEASRQMAYKHYFPNKPVGAVLVLITGGGHTMKVWEETPDGRDGWAPIFAKNGREVIIVDWATGPETLTQRGNMGLIKKVVEKELAGNDRKIVWLGWSMGGPQAFILAADLLPQRTAAILGYGATGPLNFYNPKDLPDESTDLQTPAKISSAKIDRISDSPLFPKEYKKKYIAEYLIPIPPLMTAIQSKHPAVADRWEILTVENPKAIPPALLVNGTRDPGHSPEREKPFENWMKQYQADVTFVYVNDFPHLGMLCRGNEKITMIYLNWLKKRKI